MSIKFLVLGGICRGFVGREVPILLLWAWGFFRLTVCVGSSLRGQEINRSEGFWGIFDARSCRQ